MAEPTDAPAPSPLQEIKRGELEVDDDDEDTKKKKELEKTIWTRLAEGLAIASVVLAILAMIFSSASFVTIVAGLIAIGVSGIVIYQQELLQDTDSEFCRPSRHDLIIG
jgi:lipopolysaccharide export LptBFGC system permease protein LptF